MRLSEHGAKHVLSLPELRADVGSPRVGLAAIPSQTLRFVESNFGITEGALNFADARSKNDMKGFFNLAQMPRAYTMIAAPKDANFFIRDKRKATDPDDQ